ncbi:MAG: hypothetical protein CMC96_02785 [Flavobacteriales bacterium]|nr:hypothetical protein [Flavobacteriales bacterium]|tara:strand:+ start:15599 stop:15958 length:360 start_codon:yes stop_codon:yes gene_type:complete
MAGNCLECGVELFGRKDKKYCSDHCRNTHHNRQNSYETNYIRKVNGILRKNRRILESIAPKGKGKTKKENLQKAGFDFAYYTNTYTTKENKTYYYCYDYAYLDIDKGWYAIVKKKEWVD